MTAVVDLYMTLLVVVAIVAPIVLLVQAWKRRDQIMERIWDQIERPNVSINATATASIQHADRPVIVVETMNGVPTVVGRRDTVDGVEHFTPIQLPESWREIVCPSDADRWHQARHLMLVGETSSGKTTFARWIIGRAQAMASIIIIDPHASPDDWRGVPAIGAGRDYAAIDAALRDLTAELDLRYQARASGDDTNQPMLICIDEAPAIAAHCENWKSFMSELSNEGRKVGMRLCLLTQGRLVKMLNIEGRSDLRSNFAEVLLGVKATESMPGHDWRKQRPAALDLGGDRVRAIDLSGICDETVCQSGSGFAGWHGCVQGTGTGTGSTAVPRGSDAAEPLVPIIKNMAAEGMSRNQMARVIGGRKQDALDHIRRVLGPLKEEV